MSGKSFIMGGLAGLVLSLTPSYASAQADPTVPTPLPILKTERTDVDKKSNGIEYIFTADVDQDGEVETIILSADLTRILSVTGFENVEFGTITEETKEVAIGGSRTRRITTPVDQLFILSKGNGLYALQYPANAANSINTLSVSLAQLDRPVAWVGDGTTLWVYSPVDKNLTAHTTRSDEATVRTYTPEKHPISSAAAPVISNPTSLHTQEDKLREKYQKKYKDKKQPFTTFPISIMYGDFDPNVPGEELQFTTHVNNNGTPERILFNADGKKIIRVEGWDADYDLLPTTINTYPTDTFNAAGAVISGSFIALLRQNNNYYTLHFDPVPSEDRHYRAVLSTVPIKDRNYVTGNEQKLYAVTPRGTSNILAPDKKSLPPFASLDERIQHETEAGYYTPHFQHLQAQSRFHYTAVIPTPDPAACTTFYHPAPGGDTQSFLAYQNSMKADLTEAAQHCFLSSGGFTYHEHLGKPIRIEYIASTTENDCFKKEAAAVFTRHPYVVPDAAPGTCVPLTVIFTSSKK